MTRRIVLSIVISVALAIGAYATVPDSPSADRYVANGSTAGFPYTFKIASKQDIEVLVNGATKVLDVDYTVSGVGNAGGGSVTLTPIPLINDKITILRKQPAQQYSVYSNSAFSPQQIEKDLDRMVMQIQQMREQVSRALSYSKDTASVGVVDPPIAGLYAQAKADGGISWVTPTLAGALSSPVGIADGGTGATTASQARTNLNVPSEAGFQIINAKGDILAGVSDNTYGRLAIGANGSLLTADSSSPTGISWQAAAAAAFSTGDVKLTMKTSADQGWILLNDGTIGSASSGATTRANADTSALYTLLWNNCIDQWCPVTGGRGVSASVDYAANKPLRVPKTFGRALAGAGTGTVTESGTDPSVDITGNTLGVASNSFVWITGMPVVFTLSSGTITGLTSGTTYYIVKSGLSAVQLATSLVNAQYGTVIDFTAKSSPSWTLTHTYLYNAPGETGGQQVHAQNINELLSHTHSATPSNLARTQSGGTYAGGGTDLPGGPVTIGFTGGSNTSTIMQPTVFLNVLMKL